VVLGLTNGGGIAEVLLLPAIDDKRVDFYFFLLVELLFFLFVNIICLNVMFGIIIDTFSELRDKQRLRGRLCLTKNGTSTTYATSAASSARSSKRRA
jgi:hypothetical protein